MEQNTLQIAIIIILALALVSKAYYLSKANEQFDTLYNLKVQEIKTKPEFTGVYCVDGEMKMRGVVPMFDEEFPYEFKCGRDGLLEIHKKK